MKNAGKLILSAVAPLHTKNLPNQKNSSHAQSSCEKECKYLTIVEAVLAKIV
jgi:hypothetical protein